MSLAFVELVIIVTFRRVDKEGKEEVMDPIEIDRNEGVASSALFDLELLVWRARGKAEKNGRILLLACPPRPYLHRSTVFAVASFC